MENPLLEGIKWYGPWFTMVTVRKMCRTIDQCSTKKEANIKEQKNKIRQPKTKNTSSYSMLLMRLSWKCTKTQTVHNKKISCRKTTGHVKLASQPSIFPTASMLKRPKINSNPKCSAHRSGGERVGGRKATTGAHVPVRNPVNSSFTPPPCSTHRKMRLFAHICS